MKRNQKGFTLAELLIVVAVIAVLVAVAIPTFGSQLEKSRQTVDISNLRGAYAAAKLAVINQEYADKSGKVTKLKDMDLAKDAENYTGKLYFWYEPSEGILIEATTDGTHYKDAPKDTNSLGQSRSTQLRADTSRLDDDAIHYYDESESYAEMPSIGKPILVIFEEKGGAGNTSVWQLGSIAFAELTGDNSDSIKTSTTATGTTTSNTGEAIDESHTFSAGYLIASVDKPNWLNIADGTGENCDSITLKADALTAGSDTHYGPDVVTVIAKDSSGNTETWVQTFTQYSKLAASKLTTSTDGTLYLDATTNYKTKDTYNIKDVAGISGGSGTYEYSITPERKKKNDTPEKFAFVSSDTTITVDNAAGTFTVTVKNGIVTTTYHYRVVVTVTDTVTKDKFGPFYISYGWTPS